MNTVEEAARELFTDYILSNERTSYLVKASNQWVVVPGNSRFIEINTTLDDWMSDYIRDYAHFDQDGTLEYDEFNMLYQDSAGNVEFLPNPTADFIKHFMVPIIK